MARSVYVLCNDNKLILLNLQFAPDIYDVSKSEQTTVVS